MPDMPRLKSYLLAVIIVFFAVCSGADSKYTSLALYAGNGLKRLVMRAVPIGGRLCAPPNSNIAKAGSIKLLDVASDKGASGDCPIYLPKEFVGVSLSERYLSPMHASHVVPLLISKGELGLAKDILDDLFFEMDGFGYLIRRNAASYIGSSEVSFLPTLVRMYFEATKDVRWLGEKGIPYAERFMDYMNSEGGIISINVGTKDTGEDKEEVEVNRWAAPNGGNESALDKRASLEEDGYTLSSLIKISLTPDPTRPAWARNFDYNRVLHILDAESCKRLKEDKGAALNIKDIDVLGLPFRIYAPSDPSLAAGGVVAELRGVCYTFSREYLKNRDTAAASGYIGRHVFGPYNGFTNQFGDVGLNAIVWRGARDLAWLLDTLANRYPVDSSKQKKDAIKKRDYYNELADERKKAVLRYMFRDGIPVSYDSYLGRARDGYISPEVFAYVLWSGILDVKNEDERAAIMKMADRIAKDFECESGVCFEDWDKGGEKVYLGGAAQAMIVEGLFRYSSELKELGAHEQSDLLSRLASDIRTRCLTYFEGVVDGRLAKRKDFDTASTYTSIIRLLGM